ncbi:MAG: hypothetical protein L3K23_02300 [Thermoplasmata archaeon]|nr:hypothetical protein [Thermoplasmata archaeon]
MTQCQVQAATKFALPPSAMPVHDRRMSLETACREEATYSLKLLGGVGDRHRTGAPVREFVVCENHSQLVTQVDRELMEDGWATALPEKSRTLA